MGNKESIDLVQNGCAEGAKFVLMKILSDFNTTFPGLVVGVGNFDGVHCGHREIIEAIKKLAGPGGTPGIITFQRHTRLSGEEQANRLLTTIGQRVDYFQDAGIAACWVINFNKDFADQSPEDFIVETLVGRLGIRGVCIGEGFRFGGERRGTVAMLTEMGRKYDFQVREIPTVRVGEREVRSSIIRELIKDGNLEEADTLLGHDYCLTGQVIKGRGRGESLGYPTANFHPEQLVPGFGVYICRIDAGFGELPGMLYVGTRPTFRASGDLEVIAEAHIFDWSGSLKGKRIKVYLNKKLRKDITFNHSTDLSLQISKDEKEARRYIEGNSKS